MNEENEQTNNAQPDGKGLDDATCYPKKLFGVKLPNGKYHSASGIINGMFYKIREEGEKLIFGRVSIGIGIGECFEPIAILPKYTERYYYG